MQPNQEQAKVLVRWFLSTFGATITGFVVGKGWISASTAATILSDPLVYMGLVSIVSLIFALVNRSKAGSLKAAAVVNPEVTIVAPKAVADATPTLPNIVSNTDTKVVLK